MDKEQTTLDFEEKVLETIIESSLNTIDGLLSIDGELFTAEDTAPLAEESEPINGIEINVEKRNVTVQLTIIIEFGKNLSEIFLAIKRKVSEDIERVTNFEVTEVNVHVENIVTKEEYLTLSAE
ncbi:Asp23/Gls24 family envelope stress response protein [Candidatus Enterococcus clewellii]|uniref:Stress response regulator gls24 homolog n=1 Tax=Candidatus Enterococcus clewellii TaxID=1834193 RepID=A0A242KBB1_9ENTE|nr:Asp23/Gls24 family envelope stress response protein [Enterococcus sp. 9E7_DIV0242]OTP18453.1 hypothetical protein A5888_000267 [Enterococcus sp. 9E7_DIV0242]